MSTNETQIIREIKGLGPAVASILYFLHPTPKGSFVSCGSEKCLCPKNSKAPGDPLLVNHEWCSQKAVNFNFPIL